MNFLKTGSSIKSYNKLSNWFNFDKENVLQVYSGKIDIGQHISSTLALIASKITNIKYSQVEIVRLNTNISPDEGKTASSLSTPDSGTAIKSASIILRKNFINYALRELKINLNEMIFENGIIKDIKSNKSISYWDFAKTDNFKSLIIPIEIEDKDIKSLNYSNKQKVELKTIKDIVTGRYKYVHDLYFPNMLHARIIRPPNYFSKFKRIDDDFQKILDTNNIKLVSKGSFLALVASDEFLVVKYLELIKKKIHWEYIKDLPNKNIHDALQNNEKDTLLVKSGGEAYYEKIPNIKSFDNSNITSLSSKFRKSYLMHGPIGPSAACAINNGNKYFIYSHSQAIYDLKFSISKYFDISPDNVTLEFAPGSGCYGHNGADDVAFEAAVLSKDFPNQHILLKWTREDEHRWEPYGSASLNKIEGAINEEGKIVYWSNEVFSDTYLTRPSDAELDNFISYNLIRNNFEKKRSKPKTAAHMGIHRNLDPLYNFEETRLVKNLVHDLPLRTSALRTLGAFGNVVASESFLNDLASIKNIDPFDIRINHLNDERAIEVLKNLKKNMEILKPKDNNFRGIGFSRYKNSAAYCAVGVELNVTDNLDIKLNHTWITVDAGEIAYEDGIKAQVEGGFIQAASWSLYEEVLFDTKEIISKDWDSYKIIGFDNIPIFTTNVIDKKGYPYLGVGEVVAGPAGAAISNALCNALGQRIKTLPFTKDNITKELLN